MAGIPCSLSRACRYSPRTGIPAVRRIVGHQIHRCVHSTALQALAITSAEKVLEQIRKGGGSADKVAVEESLSTGAAVLIAAADISSGETIATIPESAWISPVAISGSSFGSLVAGLEPWLQIALYILHIRHTGVVDSYVSSLPGSITSPLLWTDEELEQLQGTQLLENVLAYKQFFMERYNTLQESLFSANSSAFPASEFSFDNFLWAAATVRSRLHAPLEGQDAALVPLADMVEHKRGVTTKWKLGTVGIINRKQVLAIEAGKAFRKGEPLTMDFGPDKVDNQLFLDYGVFDRSQKQEGYVLSLSIPATEKFLDDKLDILESNGMQQTAQFLLRTGYEPTEEMLAFLRLMQLQKADVFLLEVIFRDEVWGHLQLPVSEANEASVCQAMIAGATEALAQYPTAIEDDLMLLRSGTLAKGSRQELAVQVRLGEKEALSATLLFFEQRLTELETLEYYQERRLKRLGLVDEKGRSTFDSFFKGGIA